MKYSDNLKLRKNNLNCPVHVNSEMEILWVKKGRVKVIGENGQCTVVEKNCGMIIFPFNIHSFEHDTETEGIIFMFSGGINRELFVDFQNKVPENKVFCISVVLRDYLEKKTTEYVDTHNEFIAKSIFYALLGEFSVDNTLMEKECSGFDVTRVMENICNNIHMWEDAESVANAYNLTKKEIDKEIFKISGLKLKEFIYNVKLNYALQLLHGDRYNITEIAYESGFSTVRTFNRVFLRLMGCTPKEYREKINS